jgi:flagella basal body P-ring formation protein FlgA
MQDARHDILEVCGRDGRITLCGLDGCTTRAQALAAMATGLMLLAAPAMAGLVTTRPAGESIVRLQPAAVVTGDEVVLADVAELTGEASELAAGWPIAAAPRAGTSGVITLPHLQSVLSRRGVNLSSWVLRGASRCVVTRPAGGSSTRSRTGQQVRAEPDDRAAARSIPIATRPADLERLMGEEPTIDPRTLEGAIHAHIREKLPSGSGTLIVHFSPATERLLTLSTETYQFRITDRGEKVLGIVPLEVTVLENGQVRQVVQVVCEAALRKPVIVAGRSINSGEIIRASDLKTEIRSFDRLDEIGLADATPLAGQRARRLIKSGEQIGPRDVEAVPMVERNDLVTVSVRRGGLTITATARATEAGSLGKQIMLRSELSRDMFAAVVTGPKTVALLESKVVGGTAVAALAGGGK